MPRIAVVTVHAIWKIRPSFVGAVFSLWTNPAVLKRGSASVLVVRSGRTTEHCFVGGAFRTVMPSETRFFANITIAVKTAWTRIAFCVRRGFLIPGAFWAILLLITT